ncbi:MAG: histidine kinase [Pseudomonadota bacterium]
MSVDTRAMEKPSLIERWFSPLPLASYLAWGAVWAANTVLFDRSPTDGPLTDSLMIGFLLGWLYLLGDDDDKGLGWPHGAIVATMTVMALVLIALGPSGSSPILLILLATQFAARMNLVPALGALVSVNLIFASILIWGWGFAWSNALVSLAAFGSFQMFALMVLRYARTAEEMAERLRLVNADLLATRTLLADSARDQERLRLSRELHDVAGHKLTALKMNLRALRTNASAADAKALETADVLAGELLDDLRAVVKQLRRTDGLSLEQGIQQLAAPLRGMDLHLEISDEVRIERVSEAETLMRVAQEGLTNAIRHGKASQAWLKLDRQGGHWTLELDDDGRVRWPIEPGMGLKGMMERLNTLDGELDFEPSDHGGLKLKARLPVEDPA